MTNVCINSHYQGCLQDISHEFMHMFLYLYKKYESDLKIKYQKPISHEKKLKGVNIFLKFLVHFIEQKHA